MRRDAAELVAHSQRTSPSFLTHYVMQVQLEDFRPILCPFFNRVELGQRFAIHADREITGRCGVIASPIPHMVLSRELGKA